MLDHVLVEDAVHAAGLRRVEMRHQPNVIAVVASEVLERVAEVLTTREMLLESGQAARERMPARIDDLRVRQHEPDQADVHEVVRHLVDEERPAELAMDARALEVLRTERAQLIGAHARERVVIGAHTAARARAERARDRDDLGQLHRAFDGRVAGEDLLDQRRAGARQPDDEDRIGRIRAHAFARAEEIGRVLLAHARKTRAGVVRAVRHLREAQPVAVRIVRERARVVLAIFQRLAERERDVQPVLPCKIVARERRAHVRDLGFVEAERLEIREAPVRLAEVRIERDAAAIRIDRAVGVAGRLERVAIAQPDVRLRRLLTEQRRVDRDRRLVVAGAAEHRGLEVPVRRIRRNIAQQRVELCDRLDRLVEPVQCDGVVVARLAESRRELQTAQQQPLGVLGAIEPQRNFGQHADRDDVGRRLPELLAKACFGGRNEVRMQRRRRRQQNRIAHGVAHVLRIRIRRAFAIAARVQMIGELAPRLRAERIGGDDAAQRGDGFGG